MGRSLYLEYEIDRKDHVRAYIESSTIYKSTQNPH